MRPRAILLTGAPGTGKSTLGTALSAALRIPFIARDDIRGGMAFSAGAWTGRLDRLPSGDHAVEVFLRTVESLLANEVSCIVEYVVRAHRPADLERLRAAGDCVAVCTTCADPVARLSERNRRDRFVANAGVLRAAGVADVEEHTTAMLVRMNQVALEMMRTFPVPTLHVDTSHGYAPDFEAVLDFVTAPPG